MTVRPARRRAHRGARKGTDANASRGHTAVDATNRSRRAVLDPIWLGHCEWLFDWDRWRFNWDRWRVGITLAMGPDVAAGFATVVIVGGVPAGIGQQSPTLDALRTEAMGHGDAASYIKSARGVNRAGMTQW